MGLIDADKFKGKVIASHTGSGVIKLIAIDEVLTAYDVDKVVKQIKELSIRERGEIKTEDVIAIVKGGGVNGKEQS